MTLAHEPSFWAFFLIVLGAVLVPGLDMSLVVARALTGGARSGWAVVFGIMLGSLAHVGMGVLGVLGVSALWSIAPRAFPVLMALGACYLLYLAFGLFRHAGSVTGWTVAPAAKPAGLVRSVAMGAATNLLNPKAYLFMFAVFPSFMAPDRGPVVVQALVLWSIAIGCQAVIYGGLASTARVRLAQHPSLAPWF